MKLGYLSFAALFLPMGLAAQTQQPDTALTRTVVVEQEYAPLIRGGAEGHPQERGI